MYFDMANVSSNNTFVKRLHNANCIINCLNVFYQIDVTAAKNFVLLIFEQFI